MASFKWYDATNGRWWGDISRTWVSDNGTWKKPGSIWVMNSGTWVKAADSIVQISGQPANAVMALGTGTANFGPWKGRVTWTNSGSDAADNIIVKLQKWTGVWTDMETLFLGKTATQADGTDYWYEDGATGRALLWYTNTTGGSGPITTSNEKFFT